MDPIHTRADADAAGTTEARLAADGRRITRGAYLSRALPFDLLDAGPAALAVCPAGAVLCRPTAASALGAPVPARLPLRIAVPVYGRMG